MLFIHFFFLLVVLTFLFLSYSQEYIINLISYKTNHKQKKKLWTLIVINQQEQRQQQHEDDAVEDDVVDVKQRRHLC